jgi:tRNA G18 (ribose-2'-O)-methylase SpoU
MATLETIPVDDPLDPRLADFARLADPGFRMRTEAARERSEGFFVVEGPLPVLTMLATPWAAGLRSVLTTPEQLAVVRSALDRSVAPASVPIHVADRDLLSGIVGFDLHRGIVASVERPTPRSVASVLDGARLVVVAEGLNDHENLGVVFRSGAALGADAVLLDPTCADPLYRRCVRVSIGHVLTVPWARITPWPDGLTDLRAAGFTTVALTPSPDSVDLRAVAPVDVDRRIALVIGAEGPGLSSATIAAAEVRARIAMRADVDSLNVATATAIALDRLRSVD